MDTLKQQKYKGTFLTNSNQVPTVPQKKWSSENVLRKAHYQVAPSDIIGDIVRREFRKIAVGQVG